MINYKLIGDNDYVFDIQGTIFKNRGIADGDSFFNLDSNVVIPFKNLKNIDKAVDCLDAHIESKSNILIVVDPDADGYTSSAILYQYLKMLDKSIKLKWAIHDDKVHGLQGIDIPKGTNLIIVPDAGSNDFSYHYELSKQGIDVIVLDHHELDYESEYAIIVNPQLGGYGNLNLSGAGVTYKFCKALDSHYWCDYADYFLDLVALGNIADSMSMAELETRYYVENGLKEINNDFFRALLRQQEFSTKGKVNITTISFYINPLINAVIRVGSLADKLDMFKAFIGVKELVKYKPRGSEEILVSLVDDMARRCTNIKSKQGRIVDKIVLEIEDKIENENLNDNKVIFIHNVDSMEQGVTGLIANKVASKYKKPTIVLSVKNSQGHFKGSARGYDKGELKDFKTITDKTGLFEMAKGHLSAYGLVIKPENISDAIKSFNELLSEYNFDDIFEVDFVIPANSMSESIVEEICELEALWGKDVDEPFLVIENIPIANAELSLMGKNEDTIAIEYRGIKYIKFKSSKDVYEQILEAKAVSVVGKAKLNTYQDVTTPQILIEKLEVLS